LFRALAADIPAAHQPGLAMALGNLGTHFERASSSREMLASLTEAVEIYKELASRDPDLYQAQYWLRLGTLRQDYELRGMSFEAITHDLPPRSP
jgi:hypothetical protein